ncbi:MAG: U32 family peptidase [Kiritimatiellae bacterium]|nr:U32 family peptidase [Kiritimatiellia bacterium]
MDRIELLSPAGDFETALAAFDAGADAVYCGLSEFSARAFARNFTSDDLRRLVRVARARGKGVYVTFNTLVDEDAIEDAVRTLAELDAIGPTALIVQDLGVARLCREHFPSLRLHASTQLVCHNLEGALAMKDLGFTRVVLARELSAAEIASIAKRSGGLEFEAFVHGALCYSVSGLCLFSAMEKGRSGNRGRCAYCCRLPVDSSLPFSMKDLRLGADVRKLVDAGVCSLKIEGRMKSALYVASVTRFYRQILDGASGGVTQSDLETVFSRRTTELYLDGRPESADPASSPIDPVSLGHLGARVGTVKRVTRDREGRAWLRFHTSRALEKHDGLQFSAPGGAGKPLGFGISEMRQAISRVPVFEVAAGTDVEVLLPEGGETDFPSVLHAGDGVYCSMSNAVKRMFPAPSFRPSDYEGTIAVDVDVAIGGDSIAASAKCRASGEELAAEAVCKGAFGQAKDPAKTAEGVRKAFARLGETDYRLGRVTVSDPEGRFAPMSILNDLRRDIVERLDDARDALKRRRIESALNDGAMSPAVPEAAERAEGRSIRIRLGQPVPAGDWREIVVAVDASAKPEDLAALEGARLALPVFNPEPQFNALRSMVKRLLRAGWAKWEASDLATLRMLRSLGVEDITADWTLYAFNASALRQLADLGVRRFVASPENGRDNLQFLAESGYPVEFLVQQSTPLFISLTKPATVADGSETASVGDLAVFRLGGLWITTKRAPRTFDVPAGSPLRIDLSWDCCV